MNELDLHLVETVVNKDGNKDGTLAAKSFEALEQYLQTRWRLLSCGDAMGHLVCSVREKLSKRMAEHVVAVMIKHIEWRQFENTLIAGLILLFKHEHIERDVIVLHILALFKEDGQKCSFFVWLEWYIENHGDNNEDYAWFITEVVKVLISGIPSFTKAALIPALKKNIDRIPKIMSNAYICSWYTWLTENKVTSPLVLSFAANADFHCKSSPLMFMEIVSALNSVQLDQLVAKVDWSPVFETMFRNHDAFVTAVLIFAPRTLPNLGYVVSFNDSENDCLPKSEEKKLVQIFPPKTGATVKALLVNDMLCSPNTADEGALAKGVKQLCMEEFRGHIRVSIRPLLKLRSLVFPLIRDFILSRNFTVLSSMSGCSLLSKVMMSCRGEDQIGEMLARVGEYVARLDLFSEATNFNFNASGVKCLIRENIKCDAVMHSSLVKILNNEEVCKIRWFSVFFAKELVKHNKVNLYIRHYDGLRILAMLRETHIPKVLI